MIKKRISKLIDKVYEFIILKKGIYMTKKTIIKIVDIVFWAIILVGTFQKLDEDYNFEMKYIIYCFLYMLAENILLMIIYITIRIALRDAYINRLDEIDLKNDNYYREIIYKYSPGVLDYIDDFEIGNNTIIAILMGLNLKGIINDDFKIVKNDFSDLDESEKYICTHINELKYIEMKNLKSAIIQDCKKRRLLEEYKPEKAKNHSPRLMLVFFVGIAVISFILAKINIILLSVFLFLLMSIVMVYVIYNVVFGVVDYMETFQFIRCNEGEKINERLEGLKNYLKDFTSIENKSQEELVIWEDYLIYSVIFNQNKKIIKEYQEKIDRM